MDYLHTDLAFSEDFQSIIYVYIYIHNVSSVSRKEVISLIKKMDSLNFIKKFDYLLLQNGKIDYTKFLQKIRLFTL